ncbi:MAG: ABC transporter ATP-binding protein [Actinomycetes bacterium]
MLGGRRGVLDGDDDKASAGAELRLEALSKRFGTFTAVDSVDITVPQGSFFALLGPSGCGKTTTLRMVAGLEMPTAGRVLLGDDDVTTRRPYQRPVNTVFQNYALFPHLDVYENVAFGLKRRGVRDVKGHVERMLSLVELEGFGRRKPGQLSGGQQQRVALARALVNRPRVLLLDEPLGALDLKLRRQMQIELKQVQTEVGITFIHVTHDQEEAMTMADTIAVMNGGRVEQMGAPAALYDNPATTFTANFLGQSNLVSGNVTGTSGADLVVEVAGRRLGMPADRSNADGDRVWLGVRPEKMGIVAATDVAAADGHNTLTGVVIDSSFTGVSTDYIVRMPWGQDLTVFAQNLSGATRMLPGDEVVLHWDPADTFALDASQDAAAGAERLDAATPAAATT